MQQSLVDFFSERMTELLPFSPTPSQQLAIKGLAMLMTTTRPKPALVIDGYAGSGKTSLMRAFCDTAADLGMAVVLMAPTGRAAKVLAGYTGRPAYTIHRVIYRQVDASRDSVFATSFNSWRKAVFVVDEASMVGDSYDLGGDAASGCVWGGGRLRFFTRRIATRLCWRFRPAPTGRMRSVASSRRAAFEVVGAYGWPCSAH